MSYSCLIVDDESLARELLVTHLEHVPELQLVGQCASALEARTCLQHQAVDLLFLDIEMPLLKGTDFVRTLRQHPQVILTTAYREYAIDGFELEAIDYLLKPITFQRFLAAVEKFLRRQEKVLAKAPALAAPTYIFLRKDRKRVRLDLKDVDYVESQRDYVVIHSGEDTLRVKYSMNAMEQLLGTGFVRIHRSFVINAAKVTAVSAQEVELGRRELPIGELYREATKQRFGT